MTLVMTHEQLTFVDKILMSTNDPNLYTPNQNTWHVSKKKLDTSIQSIKYPNVAKDTIYGISAFLDSLNWRVFPDIFFFL